MGNAGRKQYSDAIGMLLHAITAPAMILSAITVAALKKFILLSLIQKGNHCSGRNVLLWAVTENFLVHEHFDHDHHSTIHLWTFSPDCSTGGAELEQNRG